MNIEKQLKHLKLGKILGKVVIGLGVLLFLGGFAVMYFLSYRDAEGLYTASLVLLILGLVTYLFFRVYISYLWIKNNKDIPNIKKRNKGIAIHLSIDLVLLATLITAVPLAKNYLGDIGDMLYYSAASFLDFDNSLAVEANEKTGGFIKGVCHFSDQSELSIVKNANIEWTRIDLPMVDYDLNTQEVIPTDSYNNFKTNITELREQGIKSFLVTPYPANYAEKGINPKTDYEALAKVAEFYFTDLVDIASGYQISNELLEERFTYDNMTRTECCKFLGVQLEAMYDLRNTLADSGNTNAGNIILGYNVCDIIAPSFVRAMSEYHQYCDYVGLDLYIGCFESMLRDIWANDMMLRFVHQMSGLPVIECEFGYIGLGADKTTAEKDAFIAEKYPGFTNEADCRARCVELINSTNFTSSLRNRVISYAQQKYSDTSITLETITNEQAAGALFETELQTHFYCILRSDYYMTNYPHTREGQGEVFRDLIPNIEKLPFVLGCFVYHLNESEECYFCGQSECPNECGWGLYNPYTEEYYPAYYAVQEAYGNITR